MVDRIKGILAFGDFWIPTSYVESGYYPLDCCLIQVWSATQFANNYNYDNYHYNDCSCVDLQQNPFSVGRNQKMVMLKEVSLIVRPDFFQT